MEVATTILVRLDSKDPERAQKATYYSSNLDVDAKLLRFLILSFQLYDYLLFLDIIIFTSMNIRFFEFR